MSLNPNNYPKPHLSLLACYLLPWGHQHNTAMIIIIITALLIILITFLFKTKSKTKGLNLPPGSYGWPILGETLEFIRTRNQGKPDKFIKDRIEKYNNVFKTSVLGQRMAVLCGPAGNKFLFTNENKLVHVWWPPSVNKLLGTCLTTKTGLQALQMRKMMSYFLSPDAFTKLYIKTMDLVCQQHINTYWRGKEELKVYPAIKLFTFELACRFFMSIEEPAQIKKLGSLFKVFLGGLISIPLDIPGTKFYNARKATAAVRNELGLIVRQRRQALEQKTASPSQDLLSHLLVTPYDNGEFMSESVITNNILLLLFAGHDTSSCAITMLIRALAQHPQVYEMVLREQNEIASSKKPGESLQWEDIQKMRYSWNVVSETMRLWPPIIGAFREALVDINYGGYDIPKGWKLYWNAHGTYTDSSLFPDDTKFDPSRFDGAGVVPYSYVPFGGGARMCLGKEFARLEMLTFLHNVIRRFKWDLVIPDERILCDPMPAPEKGLPILIRPHDALG